jgi:hypothetical protein
LGDFVVSWPLRIIRGCGQIIIAHTQSKHGSGSPLQILLETVRGFQIFPKGEILIGHTEFMAVLRVDKVEDFNHASGLGM